MGRASVFLQRCYLDELFSSACMFVDSHTLVSWEGATAQVKLSSEDGFIFCPCCIKSLNLVFPRSHPAASAACLLFSECLVCAVCPSALPEAVLTQLVFPQLLLSYPLVLITLHCSYLGLMPHWALSPCRAGILGPHPSLQP